MGLPGPTAWKAKWIRKKDSPGKREESPYPLPIFRNVFNVKREIRKAEVSICGLGHCELFLNGARVGTDFLSPAWSLYEKTVYYNTYDITEALRAGVNVFGVMLGKGFYNTKGDRRIHGVDIARPLKLILQARKDCSFDSLRTTTWANRSHKQWDRKSQSGGCGFAELLGVYAQG